MSEFSEDVVLITNDVFIDSIPIFIRPVYVDTEVNVMDSMETSYLMGINISRWIEDSLFVNNGPILGM